VKATSPEQLSITPEALADAPRRAAVTAPTRQRRAEPLAPRPCGPLVLLVDDDPTFLHALAALVADQGFAVETAVTLAEARARIAERTPDLALVDLSLPDGDGLELLGDAAGAPEVVLLTGNATVDSAVEALRRGAADYLTKPIDVARLRSVLGNVARRLELREEIDALRGKLRGLGHFGELVGMSRAMQAVYDLIARVAATDATVLVQGESGTGKELVAATVHRLSRRRKQPFVAVNCAAVSPQLVESELFGHERGSFTGAEQMHRGVFERATGGTLFLDEVAEMPLELQARLLRVLEAGTLVRVGGEREVPIQVRLIAATNRDPAAAVADGKLREDLLYRLNVFPIRVPPLRERGDDVVLLAEHFLARLNEAGDTAKRFTRTALDRLRGHAWPGNVRELANAVQRAYILADEEIGIGCLPLAADGAGGVAAADGCALQVRVGVPLRDVERRVILATLDTYGGDKERAASVLGISLKTLYNKLNRYRSS